MTVSLLVPGPSRSPPRGTIPIRAFLCDTYGTVCDFYQPLKRAFAQLAQAHAVACDAGALAIAWRTAYINAIAHHVSRGLPFRPLAAIHRDNLQVLLAREFPVSVSATEIDLLVAVWDQLEPWPDVAIGLAELRELAIIAPLSNGNFNAMLSLALHASLPWVVILGSSLARAYKPHPDVYLMAAAALNLALEQTCLVAAHQSDLAHGASHGMQTAFVIRPLEFGGATQAHPALTAPDQPPAAEIYPVADWTYIARDLPDLARQVRADRDRNE